MVYPVQHSSSKKFLGTLLAKAGAQGYLTYDDVLELDDWGKEDGEFQNVILALRERGVEVTDDETDSALPEFGDSELSEVSLGGMEHISPDDTVGLYLREMSRVPLLTIEEEVSLAQRIEKGKFARQN